jgi:hypothetical protein
VRKSKGSRQAAGVVVFLLLAMALVSLPAAAQKREVIELTKESSCSARKSKSCGRRWSGTTR